jgi:hypothetical protein
MRRQSASSYREGRTPVVVLPPSLQFAARRQRVVALNEPRSSRSSWFPSNLPVRFAFFFPKKRTAKSPSMGRFPEPGNEKEEDNQDHVHLREGTRPAISFPGRRPAGRSASKQTPRRGMKAAFCSCSCPVSLSKRCAARGGFRAFALVRSAATQRPRAPVVGMGRPAAASWSRSTHLSPRRGGRLVLFVNRHAVGS